ncbi:MAG: hypothetical protein JRJ19_12370 [Deltaproteobacteria bacterium]|nr:hypothetical protein [Deltaproteobacteria bacterium]MBW1872856.1 hypothetical protein [Deltaproteobacteria bacterium]
MDEIVFGEYTVQDLIIYAAIFVGVLIFIGLLKKIFSGKKDSKHSQQTTCKSCGWSGTVSRYAGRCPKCNKPLGERKASQ